MNINEKPNPIQADKYPVAFTIRKGKEINTNNPTEMHPSLIDYFRPLYLHIIIAKAGAK